MLLDSPISWQGQRRSEITCLLCSFHLCRVQPEALTEVAPLVEGGLVPTQRKDRGHQSQGSIQSKIRPSKVFRLYHSNILTQILFPFLIFSYLFQTAAKQRDGRPHLRLPIPRDPYRRLSSGQIEPFKKIHFRVLCRGKASKLVPNHNYALLN